MRITGVLHHITPKERYGEDDDFFSFLVGYGDDEIVVGIEPMSAGFIIVFAFSLLPDFPYISSDFYMVSGKEWAGSLQSAGESWLPAVMIICMFGHRWVASARNS